MRKNNSDTKHEIVVAQARQSLKCKIIVIENKNICRTLAKCTSMLELDVNDLDKIAHGEQSSKPP